MNTSRRTFISGTVKRVAGAGLVAGGCASIQAQAVADAKPGASFTLFPIGTVEKKGEAVRVRLLDTYADGLLGLEAWSHVNVLYWFDQNDTPERRRVLRVHPRGDSRNPLTGVFACRAPVRPNLIALSVCKVLSVQGNLVTVDDLDALEGTPVLDLKPFIPPDAPTTGVRVPAWAREGRGRAC